MAKAKTKDPVRDEVRRLVHRSEAALHEARERWSESVREFVPGDGTHVRKVVDEAFDFTQKLLENQREFANSVLDAVVGDGAKHGKKAATAKAKASKRPAKEASKAKAAKTTKAAKATTRAA